MTQDTHARLTAELDELVRVARPRLVEDLASARLEGDLSENAGYHAAREALGQLDVRIAALGDLLSGATIGTAPDTDRAAPGTVVEVRLDDGSTERFLLGTREDRGSTDLEVYSPDSPIGRSVVGLAPGESGSYTLPSGARHSIELVSVSSFG